MVMWKFVLWAYFFVQNWFNEFLYNFYSVNYFISKIFRSLKAIFVECMQNMNDNLENLNYFINNTDNFTEFDLSVIFFLLSVNAVFELFVNSFIDFINRFFLILVFIRETPDYNYWLFFKGFVRVMSNSLLTHINSDIVDWFSYLLKPLGIINEVILYIYWFLKLLIFPNKFLEILLYECSNHQVIYLMYIYKIVCFLKTTNFIIVIHNVYIFVIKFINIKRRLYDVKSDVKVSRLNFINYGSSNQQRKFEINVFYTVLSFIAFFFFLSIFILFYINWGILKFYFYVVVLIIITMKFLIFFYKVFLRYKKYE